MQLPKFIVTGTGRCGTVYMARLLTSLGIPCGHESLFYVTQNEPLRVWERFENNTRSISLASSHDLLLDKKIDAWVDIPSIVADSSYIAAPFLSRMPEVKVIHVVRNPMDVINSYVFDAKYFSQREPTNEWERLIYYFLPEMVDLPNPLERAAYFYLAWNTMIESSPNPRLRHRIERGVTQELFDYLGVPSTDNYYNNTKINSWRKRTQNHSEADLPINLRTSINEYARECGYPSLSARLL